MHVSPCLVFVLASSRTRKVDLLQPVVFMLVYVSAKLLK